MRRFLPLVLGSVLLAGCTPVTTDPAASATASVTGAFTVVTTVTPDTFDPALATNATDGLVAVNVFSRLMLVQPTTGELKPDLAEDCLFTSPTTYECTLPEELAFSNGHPLTSSDVKFSIERAYRLHTAGTGVDMLDSLDRIVTPDDRTIDFQLKWADTQFGYALALPVASIVDEEIYDPDVERPTEGLPAGSGPYTLLTAAEDHLVLTVNQTYLGGDTPTIPAVTVQFVEDSAAAEASMADGSADVVWQALNSAARDRVAVSESGDASPAPTRVYTAVGLPDAHVERLAFNPDSSWWEDNEVRDAVGVALQPDRTLASLIPPRVEGSAETFAVGGDPAQPKVSERRPRLQLSYESAVPDQRDQASMLRDRLEEIAGMSVQLVPDEPDADLILSSRPAPVNTAFGWLQAYTVDPLPDSRKKVRSLMRSATTATDTTARQGYLTEVQTRAAADGTVLPISVRDETLYLGEGVSLQGEAFGPGWQLGLWGLRV